MANSIARLMAHLQMKIKKSTAALLMLFCVFAILPADQAEAYNVDVHFYEMYLMARYAGIGHETALQIATFNQWIDVSSMTEPFNLVPFMGGRMRRLFHFPISAVGHHLKSNGLTDVQGLSFESLDIVQENSPMGHELLWTGLKAGNLLLVSGGLHVLMDSFGHSGYSPTTGHILQGNAADRPYQDIEKHTRMTSAVFKALALIRQTLPASALDMGFRDGDGPAHWMLSGEELARKYAANKKIQAVMSLDVLRDPRYTRVAVEALLRQSQAEGVFERSFDIKRILAVSELFSNKLTATEILTHVIQQSMALPADERDEILNMDGILKTVLFEKYVTKDSFFRLPQDKKAQLIKELVRRIVVRRVPEPIGRDNPMMFEFGQVIRPTEMLIRISNLQNLIQDMTGRKVAFSKKTFAKVASDVAATIEKGADPREGLDQMEEKIMRAENLVLAGSEIGSPTLRERWRWRWLIFKYQYLDLVLGLTSHMVNKVLPFGSVKFGNMRLVPSKGAFLYDRERAFRLLMNQGVVKQIMTSEDVTALQAQHDRRDTALRKAGFDIDGAMARLDQEAAGFSVGDLLRSTVLLQGPMNRPIHATPGSCQDLFKSANSTVN